MKAQTSVLLSTAAQSMPKNPYECVGVIQTSPLRLCTLIRSDLVVLAAHYGSKQYPVAVGTAIQFMTKDAVITSRVLSVAYSHNENDVCIFKIDPVNSVVPAKIATDEELKGLTSFKSFGILDIDTPSQRPAIVTPRLRRVGIGSVSFSQQRGILEMEKGDSGAPDFAILAGGPALIGPHGMANLTEWYSSLLAPLTATLLALP